MERKGLAVFLALALLVAFLLATPQLYAPPQPNARDAPASEFSAARAREVLRELLGNGAPRPVGSPARVRGRDKIVKRFERLGYQSEIQEVFACGAWGACAPVANILAWRPGDEAGRAVFLLSHYDSVTAGPGASDDGAGVAALLEIARALAEDPRRQNQIVFLITDGEELGLLGAQGFLADHRWASRAAAVINLEARGTGGPSMMFETGSGNAEIIRRFAAVVERPATSSLFDTIYQRLPNDTDFTPFKARGIPGLNFAYIGHPLRYHTREDRLAHLDAATLQHQGANVLASARALADADLESPPQREAVFFDLFSRVTIWWPSAWNWAFAVPALLLLSLASIRWRRAGRLPLGGLLLGLVSVLVVPAIVFAAGHALAWLFRRAGASPWMWVASPRPLILAFWLLALATATALAIVAARRLEAATLWLATWLVWSLLALLLAAVAPGAAYLFAVPALAAGLAVLPDLRAGRRPGIFASLAPPLVAAPLWLPVCWFLYDGMGLPIMPFVAALLTLVLWGLTPAFPAPRTRWLWGVPTIAAAAMLLCVGIGAAREPFTPDQPQPLNLRLLQDADSGEALWMAGASTGPLSQRLKEVAGFSDAVSQPLPWVPEFFAWTAPAPPLAAAPPEFTLITDRRGDGGRLLRGRLRSHRGARSVGLAIPEASSIQSIRLDGRLVPEPHAKVALIRDRDWRKVEAWSMPPQGVEVELVVRSQEPLELLVLDESPGLPPSGRPLLDARRASAAPIGGGDQTILFRRLRF